MASALSNRRAALKVERLDLKRAEMLVEPGAPETGRHAVAGLQHRLLLARTAAAHEAEMAAMRPRHHLEDGAGFAMPAGTENDAFVVPFHARSLSRLARAKSRTAPLGKPDL